MVVFLWVMLCLLMIGTLAFQRASISVWTIAVAVFLAAATFLSPFGLATMITWWVIAAIVFIPLSVGPVRRLLLSRFIFSQFKKSMPTLSNTEREALTAGNVSWEAEVFAGMPDWKTLENIPISKLSKEERAFLEGPCEVFCSMLNSYEMNKDNELPPNILAFLRDNGFLGMIIPKQFGGLEFSHYAHSQVITKIASVSCVAGILTSVPNSLGPAELLLRYGTDNQKNHYLPRLAKGIDVPCFALTSPTAGSDAGAIEDNGVVCEAEFDGRRQLCIRLNFNKRYITLAPVATLVGLAFKLYDPDHLIGPETELGITCALLPSDTLGMDIGRKHVPMKSAFPNGPVRGKDVIVPIDYIIGGVKMAGQGWRMLMECLAAGRSISLPSMVTGGARMAMLASGAYSRIRRQFNMPIGRFGGVEEVLTRIATNTYMMEATRAFTVSLLDQGMRPAVASAISKYHCTERGRQVVTDAMDVHGGKGICMGPSNYLAQGYMEAPVAITVEGANILTRSMIIFGQGAIRCHPYVLKEMMAAENKDDKVALKTFDKAFFAHLGFILSNGVRSFVLGFTKGYLSRAPQGELKRYYQQFARFSAALAFMADIAMFSMGDKLKRAEKISARYGDLLSYLYMGSAVLRYYKDSQMPKDEMVIVRWICEDLLHQLQKQLNGILDNFPSKVLAGICRGIVFPTGRGYAAPSDRLGAQVVRLITEPSEFRARIAKDIYSTPNENNPAAKLEKVMEMAIAVEPIEKQVNQAAKEKRISGKTFLERVQSAVTQKVITSAQSDALLASYHATLKAISVDDFAPASSAPAASHVYLEEKLDAN